MNIIPLMIGQPLRPIIINHPLSVNGIAIVSITTLPRASHGFTIISNQLFISNQLYIMCPACDDPPGEAHRWVSTGDDSIHGLGEELGVVGKGGGGSELLLFWSQSWVLGGPSVGLFGLGANLFDLLRIFKSNALDALATNETLANFTSQSHIVSCLSLSSSWAHRELHDSSVTWY